MPVETRGYRAETHRVMKRAAIARENPAEINRIIRGTEMEATRSVSRVASEYAILQEEVEKMARYR